VNPGRLLKPAVFMAALLPFLDLLRRLFTDALGANPVETLTEETGIWALRLLLLTLILTPLRQLSGWQRAGTLRRMLGLYAFFYATAHLTTFLLFDHQFDPVSIAEDILKRPYITLGFSAFLLLLPLAVTSTDRMLRRLGGRRWRRLHSLVYPAATLVVLHFLWQVKADHREPLIYGVLLVILLLLRLPPRLPRLRLSPGTA